MASEPITATTDLTTKYRYLHGWNLTENAGTPAEARVQIRDGSSGGTVLADIRIPASASVHVSLRRPIYCASGVYALVSTGTVRGSLQAE